MKLHGCFQVHMSFWKHPTVLKERMICVKIGIPKRLRELKECTGCHAYTQSGYELRDNNSTRFVCEDCFRNVAAEYPLCGYLIEICRNVIERIVPEGKKPSFQAGYLLGKKEDSGGLVKLTVTEYLNSLSSDKGTVTFFSPDDVGKLRRLSKEKSCSVIAIYRTSPSGSPDFNSLDTSTVSDMVNAMPYVIVGGTGEIQISARDKSYPDYEYGVTVI